MIGECKFNQYDFIKKLYQSLPDNMKGKYHNTPAPDNLFKVSPGKQELDHKRRGEYHTITAKTLWMSQRSRPNLQLATGFHCTRVKCPTEEDWEKLKQLMQYLWETQFIPLIIKQTSDGTIICIDGAHAMHMDARGHRGLFVTQGKGTMINVSKRLGVATTSSTETEVVSTGEGLPKCTWFQNFRIAQGGEESEDVLMHDNKSVILLQKNYPYSMRKGMKHVHVRYYFAVDKIKKKEIMIIHCPTEEMIAEYSSKPNQGKTFVKFRNTIMGICEKDFKKYKDNCVKMLKQHDPYFNKENLYDI